MLAGLLARPTSFQDGRMTQPPEQRRQHFQLFGCKLVAHKFGDGLSVDGPDATAHVSATWRDAYGLATPIIGDNQPLDQAVGLEPGQQT